MAKTGTIGQTESQYLHPILQKWISEQGWTDLRPIQRLAIPAILHTAEDWIISAPTASGKTEAAFLPILSTLLEDPQPGLRALCLCPTKTLVDDLHLRLTPLANATIIGIHRLHGDIPAQEKRQIHAGILITTPESLESLLMRVPMTPTFQNLRFGVIDELHALSNNERGIQTLSLLHRIETLIRNQVPRIGLSASPNPSFALAHHHKFSVNQKAKPSPPSGEPCPSPTSRKHFAKHSASPNPSYSPTLAVWRKSSPTALAN